MNKQEKLKAIADCYVPKKVDDEREYVIIRKETGIKEFDEAIAKIQYELNERTGTFELDYDIMKDACSIIAEKTLDGKDRDSLTGDDLDFYADADSNADVHTAVQLSYLKVNNESEISDLMKDEAITSIAQACSVWYTQRVVEVCEAIKAYILE